MDKFNRNIVILSGVLLLAILLLRAGINGVQQLRNIVYKRYSSQRNVLSYIDEDGDIYVSGVTITNTDRVH